MKGCRVGRWGLGLVVGLVVGVLMVGGCASDGAGAWPGYETEEVARWLTVGQLVGMDEGEPLRVEKGQRARPVTRLSERGSALGSGARYLVWVVEPSGVIYAERQRPGPVVWHGPIRPVDVPKPARVLAAEARAEAESRARLQRLRGR
ncbi:MAG: hypothetical protein AAF750_10430 [Planctomycetota bacterium]